MKHLQLSLMALAMCAFFACESQDPDMPPQPQEEVIPSAFPKKHLLEEFTGQDCGYCPYGMDCVHDFMGTDTNYVLILHHYGFHEDNFSVAGSQAITTALGVSGAPSMTINRATTRSEAGNVVVFHPGYLPTVNKTQLADSTYASVVITNTYDAASRELKVHVRGALCTETHPALRLTVLVKESGMLDYQADKYGSYAGWQEFCHANAVRAFLSAATGDDVTVDSTRHYEADYTLTLNSAWKENNCMVVAFLTESFQPIVQAEQKPVVGGTQGGADILHGGVTPVPVADYYPEPGETKGPADIIRKDTLKFTTATAYSKQFPQYNATMWTIQTWNTSATCRVSGTVCIPFAQFYVFTTYSATPALTEGTYPFNLSEQPGTALAGFRDDENFTIDGSMLYLASRSYFQNNQLQPLAQWLIADGEMIITENGWSVSGHARNGAPIELVGTTAIKKN